MPLSKALRRVATLGTDHPEVDLSDLMDRSKQPERNLLQQVASLKLQERVGRIPSVAESPLPDSSAADERPVCSIKAVQHLTKTIKQNPSNREYQVEQLRSLFLQSWLETLQKCGIRIPQEFLQVILDLVARHQNRSALLLSVLDEWSQQVVTHYPVGKGVLKHRLFSQVISLANLGVLYDWWKKASLSLQLELSKLLVEDNEAFLEALLDSTPRNTHYVLRGMLAKLPNSKFSQLMMDYARQLAHIEMIDGHNWFIVDRLDDLDDPSLERYGIAGKGLNVKTVVRRILSYVPPAFWCEYFGLSHSAFVAAIQNNTSFATTMWKALASASFYYQQPQFADDIFDYAFRQLDRHEKGRVATMMSPQKLQTAAINTINHHSEALSRRHPTLPLLEACEFEWTQDLVTAFVGMMRENIHSNKRNFRFQDIAVRLMRTAAFYTPLALRDDLMTVFEEEEELSQSWSSLQDKSVEIFMFRQELLDVLELDTP